MSATSVLSSDHLHPLNGAPALVLCRRAVERLAVTAEDVLSAGERCNVIDVGLRDPFEPDVPCTVPQCGEEMSNALPDYVCDPMYGSTGIGGCYPICTDELGSDSGTCNCARAHLPALCPPRLNACAGRQTARGRICTSTARICAFHNTSPRGARQPANARERRAAGCSWTSPPLMASKATSWGSGTTN